MNSAQTLTATLMLIVAHAAFAIDGYDLSWSTIDCGGGQSSAFGYDLHGSIGQPDAGTMSSDAYTLEGGFWTRGDITPQLTCPADLNHDGVVDVSDLLILLSGWGPCQGSCKADITDDATVDVSDLLGLLSAWGPCPNDMP